MKLAVFSDVHGNLPALEAMLKDAGRVDGYICLGDMVNYGPWSNECVELITGLAQCTILQGNHERYFLAKKYTGANVIVRTFFDFCIKGFRAYHLIDHLKLTCRLGTYHCIHTINDATIYPDSTIRLDKNYVIGHSHYQFMLRQGPYTLYNAGSVGQNRQYINVVEYMLYYPGNGTFELKQVIYDEQLLLNKMKALGYPSICVEYYHQKKRKL